MKKILLALSVLIACIGIFVGCDTLTPSDQQPTGPDSEPTVSPLAAIEACYAKIGEAESIAQTITITGGKVTQYESSKTFTKEGGSYRVEGTVKRLNDLTADTAYTETTVSETVAAGEFDVRVKFDELYYSGWEVKDNTLTATVNDNSVKLALGITGDLPAPVHNMQLTVATDGTHVKSIGIGYASGSSTVAIALTFTY